MTKDQWADLAERAAATFFQGAVAVAPVGPIADWPALRSALVTMSVAGGAAVLSAARSMLRAKSRRSSRPS